MDSEKIKNMWKEQITSKIDSYSDAQIEAIILKNARKAVGSSSVTIPAIVILVLLTPVILWVGTNYSQVQMRPYWIILSILMGLAALFCAYSFFYVQRYSYSIPLRDWIEARIKELDKGINRRKKYSVVLPYASGISFLTAHNVLLRLIAGITLPSIALSFAVGLAVMIVVNETMRRIAKKRMIEARRRLQELYDQLES